MSDQYREAFDRSVWPVVADTAERQASRTGNGETATIAQVVGFAPGVPLDAVAYVHDPIEDQADDLATEIEAFLCRRPETD